MKYRSRPLSKESEANLRGLTAVLLVLSFFIQPIASFAQTVPTQTSNVTSQPTAPSTPSPDINLNPTESNPFNFQQDGVSAAPSSNETQPSSAKTTTAAPSNTNSASSLSSLSTSGTPKDRNLTDGVKNTVLPELSGGSLGYEYKITVPPGRNGIMPNLSLIYNNQNTSILNAFGYGWETNIPYIERSNKSGTDKLYVDNNFVSTLDGELATTSSATTTQYGAKIDDGSFRKYSFNNNYWIVTDKNGTKYTFALSPSTRMSDPNDSTKVYRWMLEEIRDKNSNYVSYSYVKADGYIYPNQILYTGSYGNGFDLGKFQINFSLQGRVGHITATSSQSAFEASARYEISEINESVNSNLVKKYSLAYQTGENNNRYLLTSVTET